MEIGKDMIDQWYGSPCRSRANDPLAIISLTEMVRLFTPSHISFTVDHGHKTYSGT